MRSRFHAMSGTTVSVSKPLVDMIAIVEKNGANYLIKMDEKKMQMDLL